MVGRVFGHRGVVVQRSVVGELEREVVNATILYQLIEHGTEKEYQKDKNREH